MVASDLDGTIREAREPFNSLRDDSRFGSIRYVAGMIGALTARRINHQIDANLYVTGSPTAENFVTKLWLRYHKISRPLYANPNVSRYDCTRLPTNESSAQHKIDVIKEHEITKLHEDSTIQGRLILQACNIEIEYADQPG